MTTVSKLAKILAVLEKHGKSEESVQADHDIIYLTLEDEDSPLGIELAEIGAHWTDEYGCWCIYC